MELNKLIGDVKGVVAKADIVEGMMVLFTAVGDSYDFGSRTDLPGVKVPTTLDESKRARFIVTWAVDNRQPPYYTPMPSYDWSLRQGFGGTANVPFNALVRLTYPGYQDGQTIPSGTPCLVYGAGTFTIPSGSYIYNASLTTPGAALAVSYSGANAGKLEYTATWDASVVVAVVEEYDSSTGDLVVSTREF